MVVALFARNLFDVRGALGSGIQCNEFVCEIPVGLRRWPENLHLRQPARTPGHQVGGAASLATIEFLLLSPAALLAAQGSAHPGQAGPVPSCRILERLALHRSTASKSSPARTTSGLLAPRPYDRARLDRAAWGPKRERRCSKLGARGLALPLALHPLSAGGWPRRQGLRGGPAQSFAHERRAEPSDPRAHPSGVRWPRRTSSTARAARLVEGGDTNRRSIRSGRPYRHRHPPRQLRAVYDSPSG